MNFIYFIVAIIISTILFGIILNVLNQSILNQDFLKLFSPLQKLVENAKRKQTLRIIVDILMFLICIIINNYLNLNYIVFGIIIGFFISLIDVIFSTGLGGLKYYN